MPRREVGPDSSDRTNDTGTGTTPGQVNDETRLGLLDDIGNLPAPDSNASPDLVGNLTLTDEGRGMADENYDESSSNSPYESYESGGGDSDPSSGYDPSYDEVTGGVHNLVGDPLVNSPDPVPGMNPTGEGWETVPGTEATGLFATGPTDESGQPMVDYFPNLSLVDQPGDSPADGGDVPPPGGSADDMLQGFGIDDPSLAEDMTSGQAATVAADEAQGMSSSEAVQDTQLGMTSGQAATEAADEAQGMSSTEAIQDTQAGLSADEAATEAAAEAQGVSPDEAMQDTEMGLTADQTVAEAADEAQGMSPDEAMSDVSGGGGDSPGYSMSEDGNVADFGNYQVDFGGGESAGDGGGGDGGGDGGEDYSSGDGGGGDYGGGGGDDE